MRECFGTLLDDQHFLKWLSKEVDHKLYQFKNLISSKRVNNRKSYSVPTQEIYDFWLQNSITLNDSTNSSKRVSKMSFSTDFKEITDENVWEEEKTRKKGSKVKMIVGTKRIYTDSVRTLLKRFNEDRENPISLTAFYVLKPSEKEKQSCLCIVYVLCILLFESSCHFESHQYFQNFTQASTPRFFDRIFEKIGD